tara:strand:- start:832 stop:1545 length:714 start_codon:yes stop_codon:yes gene_type:complete
MSINFNKAKEVAAKEALSFIQSNMIIGLGTGSTAKIFVDLLAKKFFLEKLDIKVLSTSKKTEIQAKKLGLPLTKIDKVSKIDIVIDGADEADPNLNLIKGGGGALLQEKIVAFNSDKMVVIIDDSKIVETLGKFPLPIEIVKFGYIKTKEKIKKLLYDLSYKDFSMNWRKKNNNYFTTDEKHYILDLSLKKIQNPDILNKKINYIPGVVETGLFIKVASIAIVGDDNGNCKIIKKEG